MESLTHAVRGILTPTIVTLLVAIITVTVTLYFLALPKIIPGIPYNKEAGHSLMGDLPALIKHTAEHNENIDWMTLQCVNLASPVIQVFITPFKRPFVIVSDHALGEEIITRRAKDFDRSQRTADTFRSLIPHSTIVSESGPEFKAKRRLWSQSMSPAFLNDVAAPRIYVEATRLVSLLREKARLAAGHPLETESDIRMATLDSIWSVTHGSELGSLESQIEAWKEVRGLELPSALEKPAIFETLNPPLLFGVIKDLFATVRFSPLFQRYFCWVLLQFPRSRKAVAEKERVVDILLKSARTKFSSKEKSVAIESALELVVERQVALQGKPGVAGIDDRSVKDEILAFLLAGYDTTATTLSWGVKALSLHQDKQSLLRSGLLAAFPNSNANNLPSHANIQSAKIPYLDAFISETLRVYRTAPATIRESIVDTEVMGYAIPKGTTVLVSFSGDSYLFNESVSALPPPATGVTGSSAPQWQQKGKRSFQPERWLEMQDGEQVYNVHAGPSLPFGGGARGCFGKKLALVQLRIIFTALVLSFEFQNVPDALNTARANETISRSPRETYTRLKVIA